MNQNLNTWLCKHFDKERNETDAFGVNITIPRKGYVTLWDIIWNGIIYPISLCTLGIVFAFLIIIIPGFFIGFAITSYDMTRPVEIFQTIIYAIEFWIVAAVCALIIYILYLISKYKVAICPLTESENVPK